MPFDRKEYQKQYREKNKDKIREQRKEYLKKYQQENKEKIKEYKKKYQQENKEKIKEYNQTPQRKKSRRISLWKFQGIICDDWDTLYEIFIETEFCDLCNVKLTEDKKSTKTTRCLDHCHESGLVRNIVCHSCNAKLPTQ